MGGRNLKLPFYIPSDYLIETYREVRRMMVGNDDIIFEAMEKISTSGRNIFVLPSNSSEFDQKHDEIERILHFPRALKGVNTAMKLMEGIFIKVKPLGGIGRYSTNNLLDAMAFQTSIPKVVIFLTNDMHWAVGWSVELQAPGKQDQRRIFVNIFDKDWGEIVPSYLVGYIHSAIHAYREGMSGVAVALLSVAIEATLRDILQTKGYSFNHNAPSVDVFEYTKAEVNAIGNAYTLTFLHPMPLPPSDFPITFGSPVTIEIKRNINYQHSKKRIDLLIKAPQDLINYWSSNSIQQKAAQRVNGLGEALEIARNKERFLTSKDLPNDFDDVIKAVRNNLIHLSGEALDTHLPMYDEVGSVDKFTLRDFLEDLELVYDFITNVPDFISKQYKNLRQAGFTI
jgi:hypothetical protein